MKKINKINYLIEYSLHLGLIIMIFIFSVSTDNFLSLSNFINLLRKASLQSIVAVGMTLVIISGQIDLSVGSIVAFSAVLNAFFLKNGIPVSISILVSVISCGLWGLTNGVITAKFKLHAFLVTLAMMTLIRGITYLMTGGYAIGGLPKEFGNVGSGFIWKIPFPIIYMVVIYSLGAFLMRMTPFGRAVYAIGGNKEAARLSGINVEFTTTMTFVITGILCGISGVIVSSRLLAGTPVIGIGWELDIIAAVIIGGTNIFGGEGKLVGTLIGILFIAILKDGMIHLDVSPYVQQVIQGFVILVAVVSNSLKK